MISFPICHSITRVEELIPLVVPVLIGAIIGFFINLFYKKNKTDIAIKIIGYSGLITIVAAILSSIILCAIIGFIIYVIFFK